VRRNSLPRAGARSHARQRGRAGERTLRLTTYYDYALICTNGHVVNSASSRRPHYNTKFCELCGAPTTNACESCRTGIRGALCNEDGVVGGLASDGPPPAFCGGCSKPYPWTRAALDAAREMAADLVSLTEEERATLAKSLPDLVSDSPRTAVAASRFRTTHGESRYYRRCGFCENPHRYHNRECDEHYIPLNPSGQ